MHDLSALERWEANSRELRARVEAGDWTIIPEIAWGLLLISVAIALVGFVGLMFVCAEDPPEGKP